MAANPIPEGYHSLTPYLAVEDASRAIEFYKEAFGAEEVVRMPGPDGSVAHAELQIGDSKLMLSDPFPQSNVRPPTERGGPTASVFMYVEDVDATFDQAQEAGGGAQKAHGVAHPCSIRASSLRHPSSACRDIPAYRRRLRMRTPGGQRRIRRPPEPCRRS